MRGVANRTLGWLLLTSALSTAAHARQLSLEARIEAQRAIERVYWDHRIWPEGNPGAKPPLSEVMPDDEIRARVEDYLKKSGALEKWWQRPITAERLQAEMERMVRQTRDAALLLELFAALGDDPQLIAETLVRQSLADRFVRNWYASDSRFHAETRRRAEAAIAACSDAACMKSMAGAYSETTWRLRVEGPSAPAEDDRIVSLDANAWKDNLELLARAHGASPATLPTLKIGHLEETADAFVATAVLARGTSEIQTATVRWAKAPFDAWWARESRSLGTRLSIPTGMLAPVAPSGGACVDDTWSRTVASAPDPATYHTAVWTGTEMIVWGGSRASESVNAGARYNPATDTWTPTSSVDVPQARNAHTAVWTGTEMIVWGGADFPSYPNAGGRYNPLTDSWVSTSTGANAPPGRYFHTAVWTGTEMLIWGGLNNVETNTGARYNPSTDSWVTTSTTGAPAARINHTAVWTGTQMVVWGGYLPGPGGNSLNTGGRYDPSTDSWTPTSVGTNVPNPQFDDTAVWTGSEMIVWGGGRGGRYAPSTDTWLPTSVGANLPSTRYYHTTVWTGTEMVVWGGDSFAGSMNTGGRYNPSTDSWLPTSTGANVPAERMSHTAVWTGSEMIVWGGGKNKSNYALGTGGRYDPITDSWVPTSTGAGVPAPRRSHTTVWTGAEMIVWGGLIGGLGINTGSRYDPALDAWTATSTGTSVPSARSNHSAVWTGTEMIVWGGKTNNHPPNTEESSGGRYNPTTDSWVSTTTGGMLPPVPRFNHTAVWTGTLMIVWGGATTQDGPRGYGDRYDPSTDTWLFPPMPLTIPARQLHTAVWTGTHMIVWGGRGFGNALLNSGGRYNPATNSWQSTALGPSVPTPRFEHTAVWTGSRMIVWGGWDGTGQVASGSRYDPVADTWVSTSIGAGTPNAREQHVAAWTGSEMIVWGGKFDFVSPIEYEYFLLDGAAYNPATNAWRTASTVNNPGILDDAAAVWTGAQMIVWGGGNTANGGLYCGTCSSPTTWYADFDSDGFGNQGFSQAACSHPPGYVSVAGDCDDADAQVHPGAVEACNAIDDDCDGLTDEGLPLSTFYRDADGDGYGNPAVTTFSCPTPAGYVADNTDCDDGTAGTHPGATEICNNLDDDCNGQVDEGVSVSVGWGATALTGAPTARGGQVGVDAGGVLFVWGGAGAGGALTNTGGRYDATSDVWTATATSGAPSARSFASAVWNESNEVIVWGGNAGTPINDGARYNLNTNTWSSMAVFNPSSNVRMAHTAIWTGTKMIVWGGRNNSVELSTGGIWDPATDTWTATSSGPAARYNHTAVWTGSKMIVWGGNRVASVVLGAGSMYDPSTNTWSTMSTIGAPSARTFHTAVWTGSKMIVWGGSNASGVYLSDGAAFDPASNSWTPISNSGAPSARRWHIAVWDPINGRMIVWGGRNSVGTALNDGAAYDFATDSWSPLSTTGAPAGRSDHTGVWLSSLPGMVVWGGDGSASVENTGGRYISAVTNCGVGQCSRQSSFGCGGEPLLYQCAPGPPQQEYCNGIDDDCDGATDEGGGSGLCVDGNACTDDLCNGANGCAHPNNASPCSDGSVCTVGDACSGGSCQPGAALSCDDANSCTANSCNASTGCAFTPTPGIGCDDGNPCTASDTCTGDATCSGSPVPPPAEVDNAVRVNRTGATANVNWSLASGATSSDVLRGDLSSLPVGPGGADEACLADGLAGTTIADAALPPAGTGYWYLIRGVNACASGSYGFQGFHGSPGAPRVSTTCP